MSAARTIQPQDLLQLRFLNGGKLSPDGSQAIICVSQIDAEVDKEYRALHLVDCATGDTRPMTGGSATDHFPRFSPDGKSIAFISDRAGKAQLFIMPVDGGEARKLTDLPNGVGAGSFDFSPDGGAIAFAAMPLGEQPDLSTEAFRVDRHVYRFDAVGYLDQNAQDIHLLDLATGETRQLTDDRCSNTNPRFSPDGKSLLIDTSARVDSSRSLYPDLRLLDLDGKAETLVEGWSSVAAANFTPDGDRVVFYGRPNDGKPIGSKSDLYVIDLATRDISCRSASLAVGIGGYLILDMPIVGLHDWNTMISADGQTALAEVQAGGSNHIYQFSLDGDEAFQPLTEGDSIVFPLDLVGQTLLYATTTLNQPPELCLLDGDGARQLTELNEAQLAGISLPQNERLLWQSVDGVEVEGWYMKPPAGEPPYPTILYIHGGPNAAYGYGFQFDFQMLTGAGYGLLFLNHRASTGYGDAFSTAIVGDWGNLDYQDLMTGVDHAIALGLADADRLGVCGLSGGGNLSCWIVGNTDRFKAAIPQNPVVDWRSFYGTSDIGVYFGVEQLGGHPHEIPHIYDKCSPITYAHNCKTPTLLVQCEHDWRCPAEQSEQFYTVLKANGCVVEMLRQPGGSHAASINGAVNLRRAHNDAMLDWFARYVLSAGG